MSTVALSIVQPGTASGPARAPLDSDCLPRTDINFVVESGFLLWYIEQRFFLIFPQEGAYQHARMLTGFHFRAGA